MRKFNFFCSLILVLSTTIMIVTLGQNLVLRTTAGYTFYFNDTRVVSKISGNYTNSEMSQEIVSFMNSWRPDEFQVYEDTGYDLEGIFDDKDSDNMLAVKKTADISFVLFLVSAVITVAIYVYFLKNDFKLVLRKRLIFTSVFTALVFAAEIIMLKTKAGLSFLMSFAGLSSLASDSALKTILGGGFMDTAGNFLFIYTAVAYVAVLYGTLALTKPPRIFY